MISSDIVFICVVVALIAMFVGFKMGQWSTMTCINNICDELRKQLDIDGKPFEQLSDDDDDDDDNDDEWMYNANWWK